MPSTTPTTEIFELWTKSLLGRQVCASWAKGLRRMEMPAIVSPNMFKSCAQPVKTLRTRRGREHNLCAGSSRVATHPLHNSHVFRIVHTRKPTHFPHAFSPTLPLLYAQFSTLYTGPIKTITTYINKYLHN